MITGFKCKVTEKLWSGGAIRQKEKNKFGGLDWEKALEHLIILDSADEASLLLLQPLFYHSVGNGRFSIDVKSRGNWRIVFEWTDEDKTDVLLVRISDETH